MEFKRLWLVVAAVVCSLGLSAQNLTISNSGETGTSGTN
jgi:hypothetical protein